MVISLCYWTYTNSPQSATAKCLVAPIPPRSGDDRTLRGWRQESSEPSRIPGSREVIVINDRGQPDFEALQARLRPYNEKLPGHLCYMVFDCLYVNGHSLQNRPLEDRQAVLWELQHALQTDAVKLTEGFPAEKSSRLMKA